MTKKNTEKDARQNRKMKYTKQQIESASEKRILVLDGAMGTMIQKHHLQEDDYRGKEFASHREKLSGCNDVLCVTQPQIIFDIHMQYLAAGADIIETCSFSANKISLADYGLAEHAYRISKAAAQIARSAADNIAHNSKSRFVAGVLGPTGKSASISPNMDDPAARSVTFDELAEAYYENAKGLYDGGADMFLIETIFDTLNAKAAIFALLRLFSETGAEMPIMISAAITDAAGRLLAGQTVEAFYASVMHARPFAVGLNCSLGAAQLQPFVKRLRAIAHCKVSAHPNAGLPDASGAYNEAPEVMAKHITEFFDEDLVDIIGGCCGSTPEHIAAIARLAETRTDDFIERKKNTAHNAAPKTYLSGFELFEIAHNRNLVIIGESANVAGSKKFLTLIKGKKYDDALRTVRKNIENGAHIIDICMDDGMLDATAEITQFVSLAVSDPEIARVPFMLDSSRFEVIIAALKCVAGKSIANSISLKEGEAEFLYRAQMVRQLGAAVVVMLFDENGQGDTFARKIEIAQRSCNLLKSIDFPMQNVIIDPNILAVATGMKEHDCYALDFIRATAEIRQMNPLVHISAGVSNLSFSFRGNTALRNAIHAVFLKHACDAGLSMAITNIKSTQIYETLDDTLRTAIADMLLCKTHNASDVLIELAEKMQNDEAENRNQNAKTQSQENIPPTDVRSRIITAMIKGHDETIEDDVVTLAKSGQTVLEIVEGPLMSAMQQIGDLFEKGALFLPQVIRSARVMKKAVAALDEYLPNSPEENASSMQKIVLATVKGDVHDIGKNIVGTVLACTGFSIIDLGVMVDAHTIIDTAIAQNADAIGLSGLITPSLDEMLHVAKMMQERGMHIPLLIGGAAASVTHTALKLQSVYSAPVVYISDAGRVGSAVRALLNETKRAAFLAQLEQEYDAAIALHQKKESAVMRITLEQAQKNKFIVDWTNPANKNAAIKPKTIDLNNYPLERVASQFSDRMFLNTWFKKNESSKNGCAEKTENGKLEETRLLHDAHTMLEKLVSENSIELRGIIKILHAQKTVPETDDVSIGGIKFSFFRNTEKKQNGEPNVSLCDFLAPNDYVGLFALSAGFGKIAELKKDFEVQGDDYNAIMLALIADNLAECFSAEAHRLVGGRGIRPAFGYSSCPDHSQKRLAFELLGATECCGITLTESAMLIPVSSVCGMYFFNPCAFYF
ncbi:MAG: methionine synthase [Treponemataceae bacterium]|nr:MAG: methionine synthase [Treponemataceae bacterium]